MLTYAPRVLLHGDDRALAVVPLACWLSKEEYVRRCTVWKLVVVSVPASAYCTFTVYWTGMAMQTR